MMESLSHDDLWAFLLHEAGHLDVPHDGGPRDDGHGPRWAKSVGDRGITVDATRDTKDGLLYFSHTIIPGGALDKLRTEWLSRRGLPVRPPHHAHGDAQRPTEGHGANNGRGTVVALDGSASMCANGLDGRQEQYGVALAALEKWWPSAPRGARILLFKGDITEYDNPRELPRRLGDVYERRGAAKFGGTDFALMLEAVARINPKELYVFSDGGAGDVADAMRARDLSTCDIVPHYFECRDERENRTNMEFMRRLARRSAVSTGRRQEDIARTLEAHTKTEPRPMADAIPQRAQQPRVSTAQRQPVAYNATQRALPDLSAEVQRMIASAQTQLETSTHFAEMSARLNDVAHGLRSIRGEQEIIKAALAASAMIAGHTNQILAHHGAQYSADEAHGNQALATLAEGMTALVNMLGGVSRDHHAGLLMGQAQRSAALDAASTTIQIGDFSLDQSVFNKASALLGSRATTAPQLSMARGQQGSREVIPMQRGRRVDR
jgi:hypothetical protein